MKTFDVKIELPNLNKLSPKKKLEFFSWVDHAIKHTNSTTEKFCETTSLYKEDLMFWKWAKVRRNHIIITMEGNVESYYDVINKFAKKANKLINDNLE